MPEPTVAQGRSEDGDENYLEVYQLSFQEKAFTIFAMYEAGEGEGVIIYLSVHWGCFNNVIFHIKYSM
jgi:hypothetical protein